MLSLMSSKALQDIENMLFTRYIEAIGPENQSKTNGPIKAHLTIAQA